MLKKSLIALAAVAALTSSLAASSVHSNQSFGYSYIDLGSGITGNGGTFGYDLSLPIDGEKIPVKGLEVGIGINVDFYALSGDTGSVSSLGGGNGELTVGYRFMQDKALIKAGIGYDYLADSNLYFSGMQYSASATYKIYDNFGLEAIYTYSSLEPSIGSGTFDTSKIGLNLVFGF